MIRFSLWYAVALEIEFILFISHNSYWLIRLNMYGMVYVLLWLISNYSNTTHPNSIRFSSIWFTRVHVCLCKCIQFEDWLHFVIYSLSFLYNVVIGIFVNLWNFINHIFHWFIALFYHIVSSWKSTSIWIESCKWIRM